VYLIAGPVCVGAEEDAVDIDETEVGTVLVPVEGVAEREMAPVLTEDEIKLEIVDEGVTEPEMAPVLTEDEIKLEIVDEGAVPEAEELGNMLLSS
jgi:hypothetical protein